MWDTRCVICIRFFFLFSLLLLRLLFLPLLQITMALAMLTDVYARRAHALLIYNRNFATTPTSAATSQHLQRSRWTLSSSPS